MSELWVYVETLAASQPIVLSPDESRHVATRRLRAGDPVVVFDGCGGVAEARLESITRRETRVEVGRVREIPRPESRFVLATAIPKGDRLSTMLQMLSQLGLETWQPLVLDESSVRELDARAPRLQRILIESAKVARRPWLMTIRDPIGLADVLASADGPIFFGDREGPGGLLDPDSALLLVGPEAGFSEHERRTIVAAGGQPRRFSAHNLRIETAAIAAAVARNLSQGVVDDVDG